MLGGDRGTDPPLRLAKLGKCASRHSFARLLLEYSASLAINAVWWPNLPLAYRREIGLDLVCATKPGLLPYMAGERLVRDVPFRTGHVGDMVDARSWRLVSFAVAHGNGGFRAILSLYAASGSLRGHR